MNESWLIWSVEHNAWWRPAENGYTRNVRDAGRYTLEHARSICRAANAYIGIGGPYGTMVAEADVVGSARQYTKCNAMTTTSLVVRSDGNIESIGEPLPEMAALGPSVKRRASNILPLSLPKRCAFLLLRTMFGENGRVASFTREWRGPWLCTLFATGEQIVRTNRQDCIDWEHERLLELMSS